MNNIAKIQLSVIHFDPQNLNASPQMLIHNKEGDLWYEGDATSEVIELMNGRAKAYFTYELNEDKVVFLNPAIPQDF